MRPVLGRGKTLEKHNLELKQKWDDEYLKWICGFANSSGGRLEIGRKDKTGEVIGVANPKKLMEDLPNKIRSATGVIPAIDLLESDGKPYIVITVKPYTFPVSCQGKYYIRSGGTNQELSGIALDEFMLRVLGKTWDGVPVPYVKYDDFDGDAFRAFRRKAIESGRLTAKYLEITNDMLLRNLRLTDDKFLTKAALLLFHQDPENWVPGAYVKIGFFENASDLLYQDEIHGPLITMADRVEDLVYLKYFKGIISYEGLQRIETYPVPRIAFREAVLNAIVHRDYSTGNPIHIHIYPDRVLIYNDGRLPENWTEADLMSLHSSVPHNPLVAGVFFRSGQIEAWGRGILKIREACQHWGKPEPFYRIRPTEVMIGFHAGAGTEKKTVRPPGRNPVPQPGKEITEDLTVLAVPSNIMSLMRSDPKITAKAIAKEIGLARHKVQAHILDLKKAGFVERVGAAKGGSWVVK